MTCNLGHFAGSLDLAGRGPPVHGRVTDACYCAYQAAAGPLMEAAERDGSGRAACGLVEMHQQQQMGSQTGGAAATEKAAGSFQRNPTAICTAWCQAAQHDPWQQALLRLAR